MKNSKKEKQGGVHSSRQYTWLHSARTGRHFVWETDARVDGNKMHRNTARYAWSLVDEKVSFRDSRGFESLIG